MSAVRGNNTELCKIYMKHSTYCQCMCGILCSRAGTLRWPRICNFVVIKLHYSQENAIEITIQLCITTKMQKNVGWNV